MTRTVTIEPVSRIEGHARITIEIGDDGDIRDAHFHVTQFRGFERFVQGRPLTEMPSITARICGICPVSHMMASAKTCDALLAVEIPPAAVRLRRIMHYAQTVQSHALSFFHLSSPDLLLGMDADPAERNVFGLIDKYPELARDGVALRRWGQDIIARLGGKRIHPAWAVPGGVSEPLSAEDRDEILRGLPEAMDIVTRTLDFFKKTVDGYADEIAGFANFDSMFLAMVGPEGELELYDGDLRMIDEKGEVVVDRIHPPDYADYIGEAVEDFSYLKSPFFKPMGYPGGFYRVGPLARLNCAAKISTPRAQEELTALRERFGHPVLGSFFFHYARLVEILHGIEVIKELLHDPDILDTFVRARARPNRLEAVGVAEAPRGTLIHHYRIDHDGQIRWANLIIATGHNNLAMNRGIKEAARRFVDGNRITEGMLNRVEAVIRCFDPCLSCSTHAFGQMPMQVSLVGPGGVLLDEVARA